MATRNIKGTIQARYDTAANWASKNPVLAVGEFGYDSTNKIVKIGDGTTLWKSLPSLANKTLASSSWAEIAELSANGNAQAFFAVGDKKTIQLTTGENITLVILGFNHDNLAAGGKAGITFGMENCLATTYSMNGGSTNAGGWDSSVMRTSTMATLLGQLPSDLQSAIKQVQKLASAGSQSTTINTSTDKLFLFSEVEIDGTTLATYVNEGEQYEYWKTVKDGKVAANRIKYLSNGSGSAASWWLRSPNVSDSTAFRCIGAPGNVYNGTASYALGVSLGFCI